VVRYLSRRIYNGKTRLNKIKIAPGKPEAIKFFKAGK
jgi:hypothetical protein